MKICMSLNSANLIFTIQTEVVVSYDLVYRILSAAGETAAAAAASTSYSTIDWFPLFRPASPA
jgi:hypothetical protein